MSVANVTSILAARHEQIILDDDAASDDKMLSALGYKQEFKRDFTMLESFAVSFSVLGLLPSIASTLGYGLGYAGTGGAIWGWIIASLFIQTTAFSMAELCSSMPTAGGLYYAAAVMAPEGWGPFASWIVGWSNTLAFLSGPCSLNYALADMLVTAGQIAYPTYQPQDWHIYLTLLALLVVQGLVAMQSTWFIGWVNKIGSVWNFVLVIIFLIWLPVGSINTPKTNNSHDVWTTFDNGTEWPVGWATIMGFLTATFTMAGYDAPFHLSEEASNANIAGPRAIVLTAQSGMYLGFASMLVIVYTVKNIPDVVSGQYGQPFGSLCLQVLGQKAGLGLFALSMVAQFFCGQACVVAAARIVFAFARDGALPFSSFWATVNRHTRTPVNATWGIVVLAAVVGALLFAGPVAIGAVFSIGAIGQYTSFTLPVALKLFFGHDRFRPGPWHLGRFSRPVNALATAWWLILLPAFCFPAVRGADLTLQTMNWTCLMYGGPLVIVTIYWIVSARKWFKGPRVNVDHIRVVNSSDASSAQEKNAPMLENSN